MGFGHFVDTDLRSEDGEVHKHVNTGLLLWFEASMHAVPRFVLIGSMIRYLRCMGPKAKVMLL